MYYKILDDDSLDELDFISSEFVHANINSQYYREKIKDIQILDKIREINRKKEIEKQLITPNNIQNRAIEIFNKNKMSINCFTPYHIKLSIDDFKNKL